MAGRAAKGRRKKNGGGRRHPPNFPPPPPEGSSIRVIANWLGHAAIIRVLFETPSGFAILRCDGIQLFRAGAVKDIWVYFTEKSRGRSMIFLEEFKKFEDKSSAISESGISPQLATMIKKWVRDGQKLAVGKMEYQTIIQKELGIHCLFNEPVMELMWGLKNLMKDIVPDEESELTIEDRMIMSQGMKSILNHYGFEVEPEMVNEDIILSAATLYECDYCVNKFANYLHLYAKYLNGVSGIDSRDWDLQKVATALTLICCPDEKIEAGNSKGMLSDDMAQELKNQAHLYEKKLHKNSCLKIYKEILYLREIRSQTLMFLKSSIKKPGDASVTQPMDKKRLESSIKKDEDASATQQPMVEQLLEPSIKKAEDASAKQLMLKEREASVSVGISRSLSWERCLTSP